MQKKPGPELSAKTLQLLDGIINTAVRRALDAGFVRAQHHQKDLYQQTERRLRRYPTLILNIERYQETIDDLKREAKMPGGTRRSKDIVMMQASGVRLTPEEILEGRLISVEHKKKIDADEVRELEHALSIVQDDPYFRIIELKYFGEDLTDDQISQQIKCDQSTTSRNKKRLMNIVVDALYGARVT
jgi:hypothetical protein